MPDNPRYLVQIPAPIEGLVDAARLPGPLPYGLEPRAFLRTVEDVHELIHRLNTVLHEDHFDPLEYLLDPAGFSGLISRTVASRLAANSRSLVVNGFHNGYPDLIEKNRYPQNRIQRGEGIEVKASRSDGNWQSHGPRAGWFVWLQFALDERFDVAVFDREPTQVLVVMVAELAETDWSWQPAAEGRIRSGTASVKASGKAKLRGGAVWVAPSYAVEHERLLGRLRLDSFAQTSEATVLGVLTGSDEPLSVSRAAELIAPNLDLEVTAIRGRVSSAFSRLKAKGQIVPIGRGFYRPAVAHESHF